MWCLSAGLRHKLLLAAPLLLGFGLITRGELQEWVQDIEGPGRFDAVFFRSVWMPGGQMPARRPPKESRAALDELISKSPPDVDLYLMRARVAEQQLDFAAAEADWKKRAQLAADSAAGQLELADFYHRRLRPIEEVKALANVARAPSPTSERLLLPTQQRSWHAFERIFSVVRSQALPASAAVAHYRAWIERYPKEPSVYADFFAFLLDQKQFTDAEHLVSAYEKAFPDDQVFPAGAKASLEYRRGSIDRALALYDRAFQPLWPPELVQNYFGLLKETHRLRDFLEHARAAISASPQDQSAAARVFYYYQQQGNLAEAQRALLEYRRRMESRGAAWAADQLWTLARLFEEIHSYNEGARCYYALYSLPGAGDASTRKALAAIINLLLSAPEQPIRFGSDDFSFLSDVGKMDPYPGFLSGIVSLLLNSQSPAREYAQQEAASVTYFHRARAAELLPLFDTRFPSAPERPELHAQLLDVYVNYGQSDAVIRDARQFLSVFTKSPQRVHVAALLADALARKGQVQEELAVYDMLLEELAARADRVPLGNTVQETYPRGAEPQEAANPAPPQEQEMEVEEGEAEAAPRPPRVAPAGVRAQHTPEGGARSPEYAALLERYISRLVELKRPMQVVSLFRREIDRNPGDPGLYERLALFLDQNRLGAEVESVYRRAIQQFPDRTWYHKLARWFLRRKQAQEFEKLTREITGIFSGSELEKYFREVVSQGSVDSRLFRQVNLHAHQRFPHNLTFVRNLLDVYRRQGTYDQAAWESLMRENWFYDDGLRSAFFAFLAASSRLDSQLEAVRSSSPEGGTGRWQELVTSNPAAAQFIAEGELWRSHFEAAAPVLRALAAEYPTDASWAARAAAVHRSLAFFEPQDTEVAATIQENLSRYTPTDSDALTRVGEIYADREMFSRSRPYWNRVAQIEPGNARGYLEAATLFWDYYLFDDALRLIREGREKLGSPALYAYEAGAVYENRRDFARALEEYMRGALASESASPSRSRLLELAKRPHTRSLVEEATANRVSGRNPDWAAVSLRVELLEALDRRRDLEAFLTSLTENATSLEILERIEPIAEQQGFDAVRGRSLERRIALTTDPAERMRLRMTLARFQEAKGDVPAARRVVESVYSENPTILGVVRFTVDFYWRSKLPNEAIETLGRAASASYPDLKKQFAFEAARKATDSKQYARARELLAPLLHDDPFRPEYLAAMAETYAREGDDQALRDFYLAKITALREARLAADERTSRLAALRRGLIPALTRLKDYAGGIDQYVEILNRYPEDEALAQEAAAYADRYGRKKQLLDYYAKAISDSPRDFRWPMVVARVETCLEDYPGAITSYLKARQVRPDRTDLLMAQAALEERLMRFDDAAQSYTQLYRLTYQNPQWMGKVAELRARQGQTDGAVLALRKALIEGRPERPDMFFEAARRLESWNMLPQAREYAERGVSLAGVELLADGRLLSGAQLYARVLTKLRDSEAAYARLLTFAHAGEPAGQLSNLPTVLEEMGRTVKSYFTPEEKVAFVDFLQKQKNTMPQDAFAPTLLPLAQTAGLAELEAQWRYELMMLHPGTRDSQFQESRLIQLQRSRMKFNDLGRQLEAYWNAHPNQPGKDHLLQEAASSYRSSANTADELRVLNIAFNRDGLAGDWLDRYLELLLSTNPQSLLYIAEHGHQSQVRDKSVDFTVASGNASLAFEAVRARGRGVPPVWARAYTGLVGLYYGNPGPEINAAYLAALGTGPIGERVGKPVNRNEQLAGGIWFYYGSRYGEYLAVTKHGIPEDYLPATLEETPGRADAYFTLAEYYRDVGQLDRALADYAHTLELDSRRGEVYDRVAMILWQQGKHDEAITRWKQALRAFAGEEEGRRMREVFWESVRATLRNLGERRLLSEVRGEADQLLRNYVRHNGEYRVEPLLEGAVAASTDSAAGVAWILDLSNVAANPERFLGEVVDAKWIPQPQRDVLLRRIVEISKERVARAHGAARTVAQSTFQQWRLRWLAFLVETKQAERAQEILEEYADEERQAMAQQLIPLEIRISAQTRRLEATLDRYGRDVDKAPSLEDLRNAAAALRKDGDDASARRVLEFAYRREIERHNLTAANFLGLAEIRLEVAAIAEAVALLRRMVLVSGEPFEYLMSAANLLEKTGHPAEAAEFLAARVKAAPWDAGARLPLARVQIASNRERQPSQKLRESVLTSRDTAYDLRVEAAISLGPFKVGSQNSGSGELDLLAAGGPGDAGSAERPLYYRARVNAAAHTTDAATKLRLLLDALAINPEADPPRILLFREALGAGQAQLALSSIEPLLDGGGTPYQNQYRARFVLAAATEEEGRSYPVPPVQVQFLSRTGLGAAERAALARSLAEVFEKLNRLRDAAVYWEAALELQPSEAARAELKLKLQAVQSELRRLEQEASRRPVVTEHLEQRNLVRPRILATARPSSASGGGKGR